MDTTWKAVLWRQFGAAIDMLENALLACPDDLWNDRSQQPEFWYVVYHTLFFLDFYVSDSGEQLCCLVKRWFAVGFSRGCHV